LEKTVSRNDLSLKFEQVVYLDTRVAAYCTTLPTRPSRISSKRCQ